MTITCCYTWAIYATYAEMCEADANFAPFLTYFSKSRPDFSWKDKKYIPNICLIKNTRFNENQMNLFHGIIDNFGSKFAVVTYNGFGVSMYHSLLPQNFEINGVSATRSEFFKADIADVLQYFKDNGGVEKFPRILIIAGELAGRCISYVSRDYVWHLTDMYYNPAATTSIPEMIQSVGRLCGRNKQKSHLHLHATTRVADALYNGFHFTNEAITRAIASPLLNSDGDEKNFGDSIKGIPMLNKKMPVGRNLTNKVKVLKREFNLVAKNDGGASLDSYKYELVEVEKPAKKTKTCGEGAGVRVPESGNMISKPKASTKNRDMYDMIITSLEKRKGVWVSLVELRRLFSTKAVQISLHDSNSEDYGSTGLLWKQPNGAHTSIFYCLEDS